MNKVPQYRECPHCKEQMALSRGLWLCRNIKGCAYTEPNNPAWLNDPDFHKIARARLRIKRSFQNAIITRGF